MGKIWAVVAVATAMIVLGLIGAMGAVHDAHEQGLAEGSSRATKSELKAQFDKGMAAGVDYEKWFCDNPEFDASANEGGQ